MKFRFKLLIFIVPFLIGTKSTSQNIKSARYTSAIFKAHRIIDSLQQKQNIPGIDIAVSIDDDIVWSEGFGFADIELQVPVSSGKTLFRIGSVSKPLTSTALGKLIENGKLSLDSTIQAYVSYFPKKKYPVTVKQIAGHIAGIRHYRNSEYTSAKKYSTVKSGLDIFKNDSLLFKPGTDYSYSSYGFNLLSAAIEGASGSSFLDFMKHEIFSKLNMNSTYADKNETIIRNRASFYQIDETNAIKNATYVDNSYKWAGGGFISTTHDLIKFGNAMIQEAFLSNETIKAFTKSQKLSNGKKTGYGIGWGIIKRHKLKGFGHDGGSVGGITKFEIFPKEKLVVIALSNSSNVNYGKTIENIVDVFLEAKNNLLEPNRPAD
ncbi:serine hydrolase domain-containing protein [Flavivirga rizhaonensis]|uniref:Class A beta-lactamase-related serine hydrolase n=1 Tax=Flavivirga rizhaonensis TaxID=2559571 RepID=A0A4S1DUA0_9FLAO|nr:serine hydrolase domain-containing protein [Flavivirga rizhaonensis]TGV01640.1 class A beta-lactamase-related serine hydrolase [Flavivirga rizhaonensis]